MARSKRYRAGLVVAAGLALSACSSDPAFWEAAATGLDQAAAEIEYENANCYWGTPPGMPYGASRKYCPGDYGYRDIYIPPESPYWRRRGDHDHGHRDRDHRRRGR